MNDTIIPLLYVVLATFFILSYIICVYIIATDKQLISNPYYIIVLHVAFADFIQLLGNTVATIFFTFGNVENFLLNKITGAITNSNWFVYCADAHLLAINRFFIIVLPNIADTVFSVKFTNIYLALIWIYGCVWCGAFLYPDLDILYATEIHGWYYSNSTMSKMAGVTELYIDSSNCVFMVFWYGIICLKLLYQRRAITDINIRANASKRDLKVVFQAFLICSMIILEVIGFFVLPMIAGGSWSHIITHFTWITCAGINAIIYLTLNSHIRRRFLTMFKRGA